MANDEQVESLRCGRAYDALYAAVLAVDGYDPAIVEEPEPGAVDQLALVSQETSLRLCRVNASFGPLTPDSLYAAALDLGLVPRVGEVS